MSPLMRSTTFLSWTIACTLMVTGCGGAGEAANGADQLRAEVGGTAAAAGQELPADAIRAKRVPVMDNHGFEKPMPAGFVLVPVDWSTTGGVVWNPQATCGGGHNFNWEAASPDGAMGAAFIPSMTWGYNSMGIAGGGCRTLNIASVEGYLTWLAQQTRPGVRVLEFRPRPDLVKGFESLNQIQQMPMGESRTWVEGGEVLLAYTHDGQEMRETAAAVVVFNHHRMSDGMGGVTEIGSGSAMPGYAFRAPKGKLDRKFAELIRTSFRANPEWQSRINRHNQQIARTNMEGARKRHEITMQTNRDIMEMQQNAWEDRQATQDRSAREASEAIRGVETYADPMSATGTVDLSHMYDNAWRMDDGSYVLTDDAFFNPMNGTRLEPAK